MSTRTVLIETDPAGAFAWEQPCFAAVVAVATDPGDMTAPTVVVSDPVSGATLRTMTAMSGPDYWQPGGPIMVFGTLRVAVTGGGDTKHGKVRFLLET